MTTRIRIAHCDSVKPVRIKEMSRRSEGADAVAREIFLSGIGEHETFLHDENYVIVQESDEAELQVAQKRE